MPGSGPSSLEELLALGPTPTREAVGAALEHWREAEGFRGYASTSSAMPGASTATPSCLLGEEVRDGVWRVHRPRLPSLGASQEAPQRMVAPSSSIAWRKRRQESVGEAGARGIVDDSIDIKVGPGLTRSWSFNHQAPAALALPLSPTAKASVGGVGGSWLQQPFGSTTVETALQAPLSPCAPFRPRHVVRHLSPSGTKPLPPSAKATPWEAAALATLKDMSMCGVQLGSRAFGSTMGSYERRYHEDKLLNVPLR
mmetsp:Transcript_20743/g.44249  ORF Transcript_20743/g.44249 Transcript_20743/m.44249 type:complete len:255 (+) Transcript_20743:99-863(+)